MRALALVAAVCVVVAGVGMSSAQALPATAASKYVSARLLLSKLAVRAEDNTHRYNRDRFGYDNSYDADGNGCYTRKEVLIRDATYIHHVSSSCAVYGQWRSLYDNRLTNSPYSLEIDHLVPLAEAWRSGAYSWPHEKQIAFGNDVGYKWDLQAVTSSSNQAKGAGDPAVWLPPKNKCTYVKAWIGVKYRWNLPVDSFEKTALVRQLSKCDSILVLRPGTPNVKALVGTNGGEERKGADPSQGPSGHKLPGGNGRGGTGDPDPLAGLPPGAVDCTGSCTVE